MGNAWRVWERVRQTDNPFGYVYRIGYNFALKHVSGGKAEVTFADVNPVEHDQESSYEPGLGAALGILSTRQRQVVKGYGMSYQETADLLRLSKATIQTHAERGMTHLREQLGVNQ